MASELKPIDSLLVASVQDADGEWSVRLRPPGGDELFDFGVAGAVLFAGRLITCGDAANAGLVGRSESFIDGVNCQDAIGVESIECGLADGSQGHAVEVTLVNWRLRLSARYAVRLAARVRLAALGAVHRFGAEIRDADLTDEILEFVVEHTRSELQPCEVVASEERS